MTLKYWQAGDLVSSDDFTWHTSAKVINGDIYFIGFLPLDTPPEMRRGQQFVLAEETKEIALNDKLVIRHACPAVWDGGESQNLDPAYYADLRMPEFNLYLESRYGETDDPFLFWCGNACNRAEAWRVVGYQFALPAI